MFIKTLLVRLRAASLRFPIKGLLPGALHASRHFEFRFNFGLGVEATRLRCCRKGPYTVPSVTAVPTFPVHIRWGMHIHVMLFAFMASPRRFEIRAPMNPKVQHLLKYGAS